MNPKIPEKVLKRLGPAVNKFKKLLKQAKENDINEADTVTIVTSMLEEVFGFDKFTEITKEHPIQTQGRPYYCDIAVRDGKQLSYLVEVKAIGLGLKGKHLNQAVTYASREGIKWVVLTNGIQWEIHRVELQDKIISEKLFHFDFLEINPKQKDQQELLFLLCKRGMQKDLISEFYEYKQSVNPYMLGALLLSDSLIMTIRRELRKLKPGIKVSIEQIAHLMKNEVIKRELLDNEAGKEATRQIKKLANKKLMIRKKKQTSSNENPLGTASQE